MHKLIDKIITTENIISVKMISKILSDTKIMQMRFHKL